MTAHDLWVLGIFQGESGPDCLATMYAMGTEFWMLIGTLAERELPAYYAAERHKLGAALELEAEQLRMRALGVGL